MIIEYRCLQLTLIQNPTFMQEDTTNNLKLVDPELTVSISRNLQKSSKIARPLNKTVGTNEVALWALQLYIVHFAKLPDLIPGAPNVCFSIRLQPWHQNPPTYTIIFPAPLSTPSPRGDFFTILTLRYACSHTHLVE